MITEGCTFSVSKMTNQLTMEMSVYKNKESNTSVS